MKTGTTSNLKFKRLKRRLGRPEYQVVGILESLWQVTTESADEGEIGKFTNEDIALAIEWEGDPDNLIETLIETGWLDRHDAHRLVVHDWFEHCPEYIKERVRKRAMRAKKRPTDPDKPVEMSHDSPDNAGQKRDTAGPVCESSNNSGPVPLLPNPTTSIPTKPSQTKPHPHQPTAPVPGASESPASNSANWGVVGERLKDLGVKRIQSAVDAAKGNGFNPPQVLALIDWLKQQPDGAYDAGVLVERLSCAEACEWLVHESWPPPKAVTVKSELSRYFDSPAQTELEIRNSKERAVEHKKLADEIADLEGYVGADLDGIDDDGLAALIAGQTKTIKQQVANYGRGRDSPIRLVLLRLLKDRQRQELSA